MRMFIPATRKLSRTVTRTPRRRQALSRHLSSSGFFAIALRGYIGLRACFSVFGRKKCTFLRTFDCFFAMDFFTIFVVAFAFATFVAFSAGFGAGFAAAFFGSAFAAALGSAFACA